MDAWQAHRVEGDSAASLPRSGPSFGFRRFCLEPCAAGACQADPIGPLLESQVFAKKGTRIYSSTIGIVLSTGKGKKAGNFILILGPQWRLHYYAHLDKITTKRFAFVGRNTQIGTVGNTGNATTTPSHLHYTIFTIIPYPWRVDNASYGYQKMFYLNPIEYF